MCNQEGPILGQKERKMPCVYEAKIVDWSDFGATVFHSYYTTWKKAHEAAAKKLADCQAADPDYAASYVMSVMKQQVH